MRVVAAKSDFGCLQTMARLRTTSESRMLIPAASNPWQGRGPHPGPRGQAADRA